MTHVNHLPAIVEEMLLDAGHGKDPELRAALLALGSLASLPTPAPSGKLAVLLAEGGDGSTGGADDTVGTSESGQDELARRRGLRAHRPTVVGLALIAGMGLGVGGVAASSAVPGASGSLSIQHMLEDWAPAWSLPAQDVLGAVVVSDPLDGPGADAAAHREQEFGVDEEDTTAGGTRKTAPATEETSVPPGRPEAAAPDMSGQGKQGNGEAQRGGGQNTATGSGKSHAEAADEKENAVPAGVLPEQAAGQGGATAPGDANHAAGAGPGVRADSMPEALRQGVDAAGAAANAVPGAKWLQKFSR
ncbi:hypothetical protein [Arthrobacter sp. Alg241-R88]|uniref:hypothetical protein n=1 Tax=Arthrobacter sp. Alg241-R88 TaxID=2305984 RepID=UPI0013D67844|nr:hypothetical protein [Arthrobacter sp. Alg241-R88]